MRYHAPAQIIWDKLDPATPFINGSPERRDGHSAGSVFDLETGRMFVFGGIRPESGPPGDLLFDETWELNWDFRPLLEGVIVAEFDRWAIYNDGVDAAVLEVTGNPTTGIVTDACARVGLPFRLGIHGPIGPPTWDAATCVPLSDSGTNGDDVAGDDVFHIGPITYDGPMENAQLPMTVNLIVEMTIFDGVTTTTGLAAAAVHAVPMGSVFPTIPVVNGVPPEFTVSRTANALFVTDPFRLFFPNYRNLSDQELIDGLRATTSFAYLFLDDRYENITVVPLRKIREATNAAFIRQRAWKVHRPASFIGLGSPPVFPYDDSPQSCCGTPFGPCTLCDALLSLTYLSTPSPSVYLHELIHAWGVAFGQMLPSLPSIATMAAHWAPSTDIISVMTDAPFGANILTIGPGGGTCVPEFSAALHPYDLYLVGLVPSGSLPDVTVLLDVSDCGGGTFGMASTFSASTYVTTEGGERFPPAGVALTAFDSAFVAVTPDSSFTPAEVAYFELFAQYVSSADPPVLINGIPRFPLETTVNDVCSALAPASCFPATLDSAIILAP